MQKLGKSALVIGLVLANAGFADQETIEKAYKEANGTWQLASKTIDGVPTPAEELKSIRMELKDGKWTSREGEEVTSRGTFTILSVEDGVRVTNTKTTFGEKKGKIGQHISKIEGDTLTICDGPDEKVAPQEFTSTKGSGNTLRVWKRIKETER